MEGKNTRMKLDITQTFRTTKKLCSSPWKKYCGSEMLFLSLLYFTFYPLLRLYRLRSMILIPLVYLFLFSLHLTLSLCAPFFFSLLSVVYIYYLPFILPPPTIFSVFSYSSLPTAKNQTKNYYLNVVEVRTIWKKV